MTIFVCTGSDVHGGPRWRECIGCGGSTAADPEPGVLRGPFEAPEGSLARGEYCSESCWADWEDYLQREKAARDRRLAICSSCGFDNQEHALDCSGAQP